MRVKTMMVWFSAGLVLAAAVLAGCAGKKNDQGEHFGTGVNHPKFTGLGDFFGHANDVNSILWLKRLDGKPVNTDWIDPAFREQLCLTLTINNHCVG